MPMSKRFLVTTLLVAAVAMYGNVPRAQTQAKPQPAATATPVRPAASTQARPVAAKVTTPMAEWGHNIGDDYFLANYQQLMAYWKKLEKESPRLHLVGDRQDAPRAGRCSWRSSPRRPTTRSSRATRTIAGRLANAEGLTDDAARALAKEGKAVVWIDGGLHATETLGAQQLIEHVFQMVSRTDEETMRFLDDVIQLCVLVNPDGMDLVSDWYMKHGNDEHPRALQQVRGPRRQPRLLHGGARGVDQHQPHHVSRVVSADHVQPSPDGPAGHGDVRAALPRSVQLLSASLRHRRHRRRRRDDAGAFPDGGEARRDAAQGRAVLDVVQRRHPHDGALPQHDRHPDRDDRQPRSDQHPVPPGQGSSATPISACRSSRRRNGTCGSRSSTR